MIHIGLASSQEYSLGLGVCVTSIFESNKNNDVFVHILTSGYNEWTINALNRTAERYGQRLEIIKVEDSMFDRIPYTNRFPKQNFYRFLLPSLFPQYDKFLYIDCDIVVCDNLLEFYNTELHDNICAVVSDHFLDDVKTHNRLNVRNVFNGGVQLMNMPLWRKENIAEQCIEYMEANYNHVPFLDQDAMNALFQDRLKYMPFRYNFQDAFCLDMYHRSFKSERLPILHEELKKRCIIHFNHYIKPWYTDCDSPLRPIWIKYYNLSEWKDEVLKPKPQNISRHIRVKTKIYNWLIKLGLKHSTTKPIEPIFDKEWFITT